MRRTWMVDTPLPDTFPLPHEVFKLSLEQGALLVYIYLVYHKSQKHRSSELSYATICKAVGLCEKTVRRHLRTLSNAGLIQMERIGSSFSYSLCPIWGMVQDRRSEDLFPECEGGWSA